MLTRAATASRISRVCEPLCRFSSRTTTSSIEKKTLWARFLGGWQQKRRENNFVAFPLGSRSALQDIFPSVNLFSSKNENSQQSNKDNDSNDKNKKNSNNSGNEPPKGPPEKYAYLFLAYSFASVMIAGYVLYRALKTTQNKEFNWQSLQEAIAQGKVEKISIPSDGKVAVVKLHGEAPQFLGIPNEKRFIDKLEGYQSDLGQQPTDYIPIIHKSSSFVAALFGTMFPLVVFGLIMLSLRSGNGSGMGGSGIFSIGKSKHKVASLMNLKTRFTDVAGLDEAKEEVMEFVSFLKNPKKYESLGAKIPKGALLVGPPGTGKTLLAKAIAGEAQVPFFSISGSDFVEMFVGVGPSRVRDMFKQARSSAPCIIWIDEIDAIGRKRSASGGGNDERENTLNQLLVEMDGFESQTNVIVLAGTNRADVLDSALLRPGRFDRQISVDAPDIIGRNEIFQVHLKKLKLTKDNENFSRRLAALTPSMTGAEIANVCNEGALIAARHNKTAVEFQDFEAAIERVIAGLERKSRVLSNEEKIRVAYHEAGHAIAGWFLKHAYPLLKVSIVPRGVGTLGYAQYQPKDQNLYSSEQLDHKLCTLLAGRASEEIKFKNISTGAMDDLEKVTQIIYSQIVTYGMNSVVGNVSFPSESGHMKKFYSESTARKIDSEAQRIVMDAYERTLSLLREKMDLVEIVAQHLLKHEVLKRDEMQKLVGPRPFVEVTTYEEMLGEGAQTKE